MNRKAYRIPALDIFLLVLLTLGFARPASARIPPLLGFDKTAASGAPGEEELSLSFLVLSDTNRSATYLSLPKRLIWGTREIGSDTAGLLLHSLPLLAADIQSASAEHGLATRTAASGGAAFANLSYRLTGDDTSYITLLATYASTAPGGAAQTLRPGSRRGKFAGEPHLRKPIPLPFR